jgi:hypothetical protein
MVLTIINREYWKIFLDVFSFQLFIFQYFNIILKNALSVIISLTKYFIKIKIFLLHFHMISIFILYFIFYIRLYIINL